jgi:hypothetical protein
MRGRPTLRRCSRLAFSLVLGVAALSLVPPRELVWCRAGLGHAALEDALSGCCQAATEPGQDRAVPRDHGAQCSIENDGCRGSCTDVHLPLSLEKTGDPGAAWTCQSRLPHLAALLDTASRPSRATPVTGPSEQRDALIRATVLTL